MLTNSLSLTSMQTIVSCSSTAVTKSMTNNAGGTLPRTFASMSALMNSLASASGGSGTLTAVGSTAGTSHAAFLSTMPSSLTQSSASLSSIDPTLLTAPIGILPMSPTALPAFLSRSNEDNSLPLQQEQTPPKKARQSLLHKLNVQQTNFATNRPGIVGHRGALYDELENTREGFQHCANIGCDAVELDVFVLEDGSVVVFHGDGDDRSPGLLEAYCNVPGSILDKKTFQETQSLQFNTNFDEFPCPKDSIARGRIPTLDEVLLDAKQSGLHLKIELKGPGTVEPTLALVEKYDMVDQCSYSSFDLPRLAELRRLRPQKHLDGKRHVYASGALFDDVPYNYLQQALAIGADEIHLRYDECTAERVASIHAMGFGSMAWFRGPVGMTSDTAIKYSDIGNEDESCYEALLRTGVQQMCVNKPSVLIGMQQAKEVAMAQAIASFRPLEIDVPASDNFLERNDTRIAQVA